MGFSEWLTGDAVAFAHEIRSRFSGCLVFASALRVGFCSEGVSPILTVRWKSAAEMERHSDLFPRWFRSLEVLHDCDPMEPTRKFVRTVQRAVFGKARHLPYPGWVGSAVGASRLKELGTFGCVLRHASAKTPFGLTCAHVLAGTATGAPVISVCGSRAHKTRPESASWSRDEVLLGQLHATPALVGNWDCALVRLERDISLTNCLPTIGKVQHGYPYDIQKLKLQSRVEKYGIGSFHTVGTISGVVIPAADQVKTLGQSLTSSTLFDIDPEFSHSRTGSERFCKRGDSGSLVICRGERRAWPIGILIGKTTKRLVNRGLVVSLQEVCAAAELEVA